MVDPASSKTGPKTSPKNGAPGAGVTESPEERQVAIAQLRGMSREDRLTLLMSNFSVDCAELGGRARRGAAAPRKMPRSSARQTLPEGTLKAKAPSRRD